MWHHNGTHPGEHRIPIIVGNPLLIVFIVLLLVMTGVAIYQRRQLLIALYHVQNRDRERRTVFNFLNQIGDRLTSTMDVGASFDLFVTFCMETTRADAGAIFIRDPDDPTVLMAQVVKGMFPPLHEVTTGKMASREKFLIEFVKKERIKIGDGIIGLVAQKGESVLIPDARIDSRVPKSALELVPLEGLILAPLVVRGSVDGVLVLVNKRGDGETFDEADRDMVTAVADQAALTLDIIRMSAEIAEKQRLEQELQIAHDFQALLLPREMPQLPEIDIYGLSQAALEVGGDYYDFIPVDEDHLGVVIADVSGKGMPGALVMATLRSTIRAEARMDLSPAAVLRRVNMHLLRDTKENVFVTLTYGVLNRRTGAFRFCRAGHEPLVCCSPEDSALRFYSPNGIVLGLVPDEAFKILEEESLDLSDCGSLILYTDGVSEAMNAEREEYGEKRFHSVIQRSVGKSPADVIQAVLDDILVFTGGIPQHDDITLVVLKWRGNNLGRVGFTQAAS